MRTNALLVLFTACVGAHLASASYMPRRPYCELPPDRSNPNQVVFLGLVKERTPAPPFVLPAAAANSDSGTPRTNRLRAGAATGLAAMRYSAVHLQVAESFSGVQSGEFTVRLTSDVFINGEPQQVLDMQPGEMWLVEAYREPDGQWYTSPGQPTKLASQAVPELLDLRAWASGKALPAHFSGETFDRHAVPPSRPGVLVNLRGAQSFSTFSDSQGHFRFDGVPPGVYEASTDPPMELGTLRIDLTKAWCAERALLLK